MKEEDTLVVFSIDDIDVKIKKIIEVLELMDEKNIKLQVLDKYFNKTIIDKNQLISTLKWIKNSKLEDEILIDKNAIEKVKKKKSSGRPKKYSKHSTNLKDRKIYFTVINMLKMNIPIINIANTLEISRNTVYRIKEEYEKEKAIEDSKKTGF